MKIMPLPQEAKVEDTITMGADADEEAFSRGREGMHKVNWCECRKKFRSSHHWRRKGPFSFGDSLNAHPNFLVATHGVVFIVFPMFFVLEMVLVISVALPGDSPGTADYRRVWLLCP